MRAFASVRDVAAAGLAAAMLWSPDPRAASIAAHAPAQLARAVAHHVLVAREERKGPPLGPPSVWAERLDPVLVACPNTRAHVRLRLYRPDGVVDDDAARSFMGAVKDEESADAPDINVRTIQLLVKAAYHFKTKQIEIVSAYRKGGGPHGAGDAIDFRLRGTPARTVASYLRSLARAGVGVYTHPRTQFVHVDARDQSFHWVDASPPGKRWREAPLRITKRDERDATWTPEADLPL